MARETKGLCVVPECEEQAIKEWESFGWEVLSSQRTKNDVGISMVKLTFSRDKEMRNYQELDLKFKEYEKIDAEMRAIASWKRSTARPQKIKISIFRWILMLIIPIFFFINLIIYITTNKKIEKEIIEYDQEFKKRDDRFHKLAGDLVTLMEEAQELL